MIKGFVYSVLVQFEKVTRRPVREETRQMRAPHQTHSDQYRARFGQL